jgi:hypothetical protein
MLTSAAKADVGEARFGTAEAVPSRVCGERSILSRYLLKVEADTKGTLLPATSPESSRPANLR